MTQLFDVPVEVVTERGYAKPSPVVFPVVSDEDLIALVRRRPSTSQEVAASLGLHLGEALNRLQALTKQGAVVAIRRSGSIYYELRHGKGNS